MALLLVVYSPIVTLVWQFWLGGENGGEVWRVPAHWLANVILIAVAGGFCLLCAVIGDVAKVLSQHLAQVSTGGASGPLTRHQHDTTRARTRRRSRRRHAPEVTAVAHRRCPAVGVTAGEGGGLPGGPHCTH
ncbi:hypothetical protein ONE63_008384 [Megalurothrips usitatus]|uniref:Uncharacterized protein n=1 Tax=Megalurothrips usitatus TaxID=439358 RepID=A0AAV7XSJ3_9NEOP|nr:hypothetical protein ONE63_008384 [Megalurothrips usitatus]